MPSHASPRRPLLERWGRLVGRHPRSVSLLWLAAVLVSFGLALGAFGNQALFDRLHSSDIEAPGDASTARELLTEAGGGDFADDSLIVRDVDLTVPSVQLRVGQALERINEIPGVSGVVNPLVFPDGPDSPQARPFLRDAGSGGVDMLTVVQYDPGLDDEALDRARDAVDVELTQIATGSQGSESSRGSVKDLVDAVIGQVATDMKKGEGAALPVSFVVMVIVFGGFLAAGLPIAGAIASIAGALAALLGFSHLLDLDVTVVNIVTVLGLGLCIDYGLLVVSRFREELRADLAGAPASTLTRDQVVEATGRTLDRAGRTVVFSAVTVAVSLVGLMFFPSPFMRASGAAGISVVLLALGVAISLIPALCALSARRLLRKGTESAPDEGVFSRLARVVQRAPWAVIAVTLAVLVTLALPSLRLQMTSSGAALLPTSAPERQFFEDLARDFPELASPQVSLVTTAPRAEVEQWVRDEAPALPEVTHVNDVETVGTTTDGRTVLSVGLHTEDIDATGPGARALVDALHADRPPFDASIGGQASGLKDFQDSIVERAPLAVLTVVLATFVLLFLMTGSVVIPIKALLMNVVSLGACIGALVWVFQDGHLQGLLRFDSVGGVEAAIPVMAIAFGFGLSMDYEVFLLARIVELHERGVATDEAVRLGLQRSGRIITSAALLMIIVFSGFVAAQVLAIKETGVALVLAIAIDATLVRMLLVPATMSVLGEWNWWAPRWMRPLHARFGITE